MALVVLVAGMVAGAWLWRGIRTRDLESALKTTTPTAYRLPAQQAAWDRHQMLKKSIRERRPKVLLLGDSLTQRWESDGKPIWETAMAPLGTFNAGIDNDRTENLLWRLQDGALDETNPPDVCILLVGINNLGGDGDTPHGVAEGVMTVARFILKRAPESRLIVVGLLPAGPWSRGVLSRRAWTNRKIQAHSLPRTLFVDFSDSFLNKEGGIETAMTTDGLHLSEQGYRVLADLVVPMIEANLK